METINLPNSGYPAEMSAAVANLQAKILRRTSAYNVNPNYILIPHYTKEINGIYENPPSANYANLAEREALRRFTSEVQH